jgi:ATP-dependent helicase/DNAse subunit B
MPAQVIVVVGPARSGKTERMLAVYRQALAAAARAGTPATSLWLAPTRRAVEQVRDRLLATSPLGEGPLGAGLGGCFAPNLKTFDQLSSDVIARADADDEIHPIDDRMKRRLIESLVRNAHADGELKYFGAIARTPGFVDLAFNWISELKRLEVWPDEFRKACGDRGPGGKLTRKDHELIQLYHDYQQYLLDHKLYDLEGRIWSARERLQNGQPLPGGRLELVVAEGFTDFTRTQHEILEELARRAQRLLITLPLEAEDDRPELFQKPRRTLAEICRRHPQARVEPLPRRESSQPSGIDHAEREVFKNPRVVNDARSTADLEVIAAAGAASEIEELARRLKRLLTEGLDDGNTRGRPIRPDDVVVVFRSTDDAAALVREVFTRYGLPFALEGSRPLEQSPALRALAALVELDAEDWPYRRLLSIIGGNFFRPDWPAWRRPGVAASIERTVRHLQIPAGRTALLEAVERLAAVDEKDVDETSPYAEQLERRNRQRADAQAALPVLQGLAAALDRLPSSATAGRWLEAFRKLAEDTGLWASLHQVEELPLVSQPVGTRSADRRSWATFEDAFRTPDRLADLTGEPAATFDRPAVRTHLADVLRQERIPSPTEETGHVRVLSAITARTISVPYLFVAGLTEKAFPPPEPGGRLYGESEYQRLADAGLPLPVSSDRRADEMLLFYEVITRGERRLWLSYSAINEKAEPLLPSPYLAELERCCGKTPLRRHTIDDLTPVPPIDAPTNRLDLPIRAVASAADGNVAELAAVIRGGGDRAGNLIAALEVVDLRSRGDGFGPYEGMIESEAAKRLIARRFPKDYSWSAGQFEQYGGCPFQFFLARVLGLEPLEDIELQVDHRRRGSRMHDTLAGIHQELIRRYGEDGVPGRVGSDDYRRIVELLLSKINDEESDHPLFEAFREIDLRMLRRRLEDYIVQHESYDRPFENWEAPPRPRHFEASFGLPVREDDGISTPEPLEIALDDERIRITGRIDRLDVGLAAGRAVFTVIDYKSAGGGYGKADVLAGRALQLTLYALATEKLLLAKTGAVPWQFGYWFVAGDGFKKTLILHEIDQDRLHPSEAWEALRSGMERRIVSLVRGIRRGEFPMFNVDVRCGSFCDFHTVCRVNQVRSLEKQWQPPSPHPG